FDQFLQLWRSTDPAEIQQFAKKWGRLDVDPKGRFLGGKRQSIEGDGIQEPLEAWRYFSRRATSVLTIIGKLQKDQTASGEDWASLGRLTPYFSADVWRGLDRYPFCLGIIADR